MRNAGWCWALCMAACDDGKDGDDDLRTSEVEDDSQPPDGLGCYADWTFDSHDDGVLEGTGRFEYDPIRIDLLVHWEHAVYGQARSGDLTYDAGGNLTSVTVDFDDDGTVDSLTTYTYDAEGRLESTTLDQDGDGQTDWWYTHSYDAVGRLTEVTGDYGNDGAIDYLSTTTYTDPSLLIGTTLIDDMGDSMPDWAIFFESDADGRLMFREEDYGVDGYWDVITSYTYDPSSGLLVQEDEDSRALPQYGAPYDIHWRQALYQYDELSRLVDKWQEHNGIEDGEVDEPLVWHDTWTFGGACP